MEDRFNKALWELGVDNPELQKAILKSIEGEDPKSGGYSIPTKNFIIEHPADRLPTGQDIHITAFNKEDPDQKQRYIEEIKKIDQCAIKEVAQHLAKWTAYLTLKEAEGQELTPIERTLKDIDITALALVAVFAV